jgi:hypothetical protein
MIYRTHSIYKTLKIYFWSELTFTSNVIYNTTIVEPFAYVIHNTIAIVDTGVPCLCTLPEGIYFVFTLGDLVFVGGS